MVTLPIWCLSLEDNASPGVGGGRGGAGLVASSLPRNKAVVGRLKPAQPQGRGCGDESWGLSDQSKSAGKELLAPLFFHHS